MVPGAGAGSYLLMPLEPACLRWVNGDSTLHWSMDLVNPWLNQGNQLALYLSFCMTSEYERDSGGT